MDRIAKSKQEKGISIHSLTSVKVARELPFSEYNFYRNFPFFLAMTIRNLYLPWLSAVENVELPMEGTGKSKNEMRRRATELLDMVGLSERKDHRPYRLSAGEQQRVAIARALANNPAIVLADEVTGNLDGKTKLEVMKLLGELNNEQGTTIVIVTHDSQVASLTSRMLLISDGKLSAREKQVTHNKLRRQ